jgi:hypothetical protein
VKINKNIFCHNSGSYLLFYKKQNDNDIEIGSYNENIRINNNLIILFWGDLSTELFHRKPGAVAAPGAFCRPVYRL